MKDITIESIGVPSWLNTLQRAVNDTYYYNSNYAFVSVLPTYMVPYYWRYIKPCLNWLDGFVPSIHGNETGIVSTKIGKCLITGLAKTLVGEKLVLRMNEEKPTETDKKNFKEVNKWVVDKKVLKPIFAGVGWAMACGTSFVKINLKDDMTVWWEGVRFDHCAVYMNSLCEVEEATFLIRAYTETQNKNNNRQFLLCEHRYYKKGQPKIDNKTLTVVEKKGERIPMVEYLVYSVRGTVNNETAVPRFDKSMSVNWKELPQEIRDNIQRDYRVIRIGEPQQLGLINIGVEPFLNGLQDLGVPNAGNLGEGMLFEVQDDMIQYEVASAYLLRDMNNGKGTVYLPKNLNAGDLGVYGQPPADNAASGGVPNQVELLNGTDPETQKALVQQFEIRVEEWQMAKDNAIRNIATKWHMSPKIINSYLANGVAQMTATQVDSEDDISIAFINLHRSYFMESINRLLETTMNFMGIATNITIGFASPSVVNKDRVIKRQIDLLNAGLTTEEDAIREIYPDLEEEQILKRIESAKIEREKIKAQQQQEMNFDGTFDDLDKLDIPTESNEKQLNGTTITQQFNNPNS